MVVRSALTLSVRGYTLASESDVCRRQIMTTKVDPSALRVKIFIMAVDP